MMKERIDAQTYEPETFLRDLRFTAELLQAGCSEAMTRRILEVFDAEFRACVLQWKATSIPGSALNYRFFYNGPKDLTRLAQEAGLISRQPSPLSELQAEVLAAFPNAMRCGIDFDAQHGFAKEWTFTGRPIPTEDIFQLRSLPEGFHRHADFFRRHGLRYVGFLGSDYLKRSMNVYFRWEPENQTAEWLNRIVCETGGPALPHALILDIQQSQAVLGGVGVTFSLERPEILRWCVYSLEVPYADGDAAPPGIRPSVRGPALSSRGRRKTSRRSAHAPVATCRRSLVCAKRIHPRAFTCLPQLPERLAQLRDRAPSLNACPSYHMGWSFGSAGPFVKLEKNYARDASYFFTTQMGADLTPRPPSRHGKGVRKNGNIPFAGEILTNE
jgi:hypothetical protein